MWRTPTATSSALAAVRRQAKGNKLLIRPLAAERHDVSGLRGLTANVL
jgi:hypothetical protein